MKTGFTSSRLFGQVISLERTMSSRIFIIQAASQVFCVVIAFSSLLDHNIYSASSLGLKTLRIASTMESVPSGVETANLSSNVKEKFRDKFLIN